MSNRKVVRINREIKVNAATCFIAAILLYVLICGVMAAKKEPITIYKVNKSNVSNNIYLDGIAVREEKVLSTSKSGYLCYYIRDGEKIKNGATVCTVDETGQVYDVMSDSEQYEELLTSSDYQTVRSAISLYKATYRDEDFFSAYNFQTNLNNKVLELTNEILMQQISQGGNAVALSSVKSPCSGIVTYYLDGYEEYDINNVCVEDFDKSKYEKRTLKSGDSISSNTNIVKIIPSEKWSIIAPVSTEQIAAIKDEERISIRINNSNYSVYVPYELITGKDGTYINIKLDKYMQNFLSERFLSVEIMLEEDTGLKVPVSALVKKEVYKIPISFFSGGGNSTPSANNRINIKTKNEDGEITIKQIRPTLYMTDDEYGYVDTASFTPTDVILNIDTNEESAVSLLSTAMLDGVYSANRGTAEFKRVTIIKTVDEFSLIDSDEELKIYDNIVLDSSKVTENQILY